MTLLVVIGVAVICVVAAAVITAWVRRRRGRRDLEGHFQKEWVNPARWASLADDDPSRPDAIRTDL